MPRLLLPVLLLSAVGCVGLNFERKRDGSQLPVQAASTLEPGRTTLLDTVRRLGPPDLLLRAGERDRLYYHAWDSDYFKLVVQATVPSPGRSFSWDLFIQTLGWEDLHLARLDYDRTGVLREVHTTVFRNSRNGRYFAIDNRIVSQYLEDKRRSLSATDGDDDDEDVELDEPVRKAKGP